MKVLLRADLYGNIGAVTVPLAAVKIILRRALPPLTTPTPHRTHHKNALRTGDAHAMDAQHASKPHAVRRL
eukprot:1921270-Pleurochrysis_carterae.AAC.2